MPVEELGKLGGVRCQHQKSGLGCKIYPSRPLSCRIWSCAWLLGDAGDTARPDRTHVVIDMVPDTIYINVPTPAGVERTPMMAVQVWVDPNYPDAWDNHKLKRHLDGKGMPVIIRYGHDKGFVMFPPSLVGRDEWVRHDTKPEPREFLFNKHQLSGDR
jgi:hypothetical protein